MLRVDERWLLGFALLSLGCASGGEAEDRGSGGSAGSGAGGSAGAFGGGGSSASGGSGGSGGSGATGGVGGTAGTGGASGSGGSGGECPKTNECESATNLGTLSGDSTNANLLSASGAGQEFFLLRATEDNHNVLGEALELKATLTVPAGSDFDLYAYIDTQTDTSPCPLSATQASANGPGTTEEIIITWGDGLTGSGNDDSRNIVVEVRFGGFSCEGEWSLALQGDP